MTDELDYGRLADAVRDRRRELRMTQEDVRARGGPSTATLRQIERGSALDYRSGTTEPLEDAIGWRRGSVDTVLRGGDPTISLGFQLGRVIPESPAELTPVPPAEGRPRPVRLADLPFEDLVTRWWDNTLRALQVEIEYSGRRGITQIEARDEIFGYLSMAGQIAKGERPSQAPPWESSMVQDDVALAAHEVDERDIELNDDLGRGEGP